jgi:hypothetical protein
LAQKYDPRGERTIGTLTGTGLKINKRQRLLHRCTNQTGSHPPHRRGELDSVHSRARGHNVVVLRQMPQFPSNQLGDHLGNGPRGRICILFTDYSLVNARWRIQAKVGDGKSDASSQREVVRFNCRAVRILSSAIKRKPCS